MAAVDDRRSSAPYPAVGWTYPVVGWTRTVVVALVAVLAVLVHHEATTPVSHVPTAGAMRTMRAGTAHDRLAPPSAHLPGHAPAPRAGASVAFGDDGACSGMTGPHCSTASVETLKPTPPAAACVGYTTMSSAHTPCPAGRAVPGTVGRAPPDLSLLSRLLV